MSREINDAMSRSYDVPEDLDENDLMAELDGLEGEGRALMGGLGGLQGEGRALLGGHGGGARLAHHAPWRTPVSALLPGLPG